MKGKITNKSKIIITFLTVAFLIPLITVAFFVSPSQVSANPAVPPSLYFDFIDLPREAVPWQLWSEQGQVIKCEDEFCHARGDSLKLWCLYMNSCDVNFSQQEPGYYILIRKIADKNLESQPFYAKTDNEYQVVQKNGMLEIVLVKEGVVEIGDVVARGGFWETIKYILYETNYLVYLAAVIIFELIIALIYFLREKINKKLLLAVVFANLISFTGLWLFLSYLISQTDYLSSVFSMSWLAKVLLLELVIILFEGYFIYFVSNKKYISLKQAFILSLIMNLFSLLLSPGLYMIG